MSAIKIILDSRSGKGGAHTRVENAMKPKRRFYLLLLSSNCKVRWTATVVWYQRGVSKNGPLERLRCALRACRRDAPTPTTALTVTPPNAPWEMYHCLRLHLQLRTSRWRWSTRSWGERDGDKIRNLLEMYKSWFQQTFCAWRFCNNVGKCALVRNLNASRCKDVGHVQ